VNLSNSIQLACRVDGDIVYIFQSPNIQILNHFENANKLSHLYSYNCRDDKLPNSSNIQKLNNLQEVLNVVNSLSRLCLLVIDKNVNNIPTILDSVVSKLSDNGFVIILGEPVASWTFSENFEISKAQMNSEALILKKNPKYKFSLNKTDEKITVVCAFTPSKTYTTEYVNNLARAVKRNITIPYEFVCLTNANSGIDYSVVDRVVPFIHNFPTWWCKMELFREGLFTTDKVIYFDLDTLITGNIDYLQHSDKDFYALLDFYTLNSMGSGVMAWKNNTKIELYKKFIQNSEQHMKQYAGDQNFIEHHVGFKNISFLQCEFPQEVFSYKTHIYVDGAFNPKKVEPSVVCFHGVPRIHQTNTAFVNTHWRKL
jgi:hypothetical protein